MLLAGLTANHIFYIRTLISQRVLIPDALPSGILIRNGIDTSVVVSVSTLVDGSFLAQSVLPSNWIEGDVVHLRITAISSGLDLTQTIDLGEIGVSGNAIASAVRTNLTAELARIDVAVSSVSGGSGLNAAGVRSAIGLASANLDTQLSTVPTVVQIRQEIDSNSAQIAAVKTKTDQFIFTAANRVDATAITVSDKTGYSLSQVFPANFSNFVVPSALDNALAVRTNLTVELARIDVAVSSVSGGFNNSDRVALLSAQSAALATADGRQRINYLLSTFTQYNLDGSVRRVFNLTDENNSPATSGQTAIERIPQ